MTACVFCRIVAGELPASVVHRDTVCIAFMDLHPFNAGHLLVVPLVHADRLAEVDPATARHLFGVAQELAAAIRRSGLRADGVNLWMSDGRAAGQEVDHVHLHVLPRAVADGFRVGRGSGPMPKVSRERLDGDAAAIRAARSTSVPAWTAEPVVSHVEITVRDLDAALPFYDGFLALLGYDVARRTVAELAAHDKRVVSYEHPRLGIALTSPRAAFADDAVHRRRPGALHHLAFRVPSRADVDRIHVALVALGANVVISPREFPEYSPKGYYALFVHDPDGIRYEVITHDEFGTD